MTSNNNIILSAQDIVVEFDVRDRVLTAIRGVSLELVEGEVLALVGESGSGKSVLTKTFTGMLEDNGRIAQGSIKYRGQELTDLKSNKDWENIRGSKIATIFSRPNDKFGPNSTQLVHKLQKSLSNTKGKQLKKLKKWLWTIWRKLEFQMRNVVLMSIHSNIQVGCVNGSLLPSPWPAVQIS